MADWGSALKARIISSAGIGAEIHWVKVPQGRALPYTRLQTISDPRPAHLKGYNGARIVRVQADFFSTKWGDARAMAEKVIDALRTPANVDGIHFGFTKAEGPRDLGEDTADGFVHRASVDLLVEIRLA